jgi:choline dehydrogenase-like flavoprotein
MSDRVAIVGSGIVGTTIAHLLVERGHTVDVFEKGPEVPYPHAPQYAERVLYLWDNPARRLPPDLRRVTSSGNYGYDVGAEQVMAVGGAATVWGAMTDRLHPHDFRVRSRYGFGVDWPIDYDELEPFYARAERRLGVAGDHADDPFAAPRSSPYPLPPFELSYDARKLAERLRAHGLALTTSPQARTRSAYDGRPACANTGACDTCPIGARYSPNHHLARAVATGRCTVHANTSVRRIEVDAAGRARSLVYREHDGAGDRVHDARAIVVAGGAIESARLLLLSATSGHPDGLGNHAGHLGQHLLFHHFWNAHLDFDEDLFPGRVGPEMGQSRQFIDPPERGRHGGVLWQLPSVSALPAHLAPGEESSWRSGADVMASLRSLPRCEAVGLHAETAPSADKLVRLSTEKDRFGDPFAHVQYASSEFDHETHRFAERLLGRIAAATGASASGATAADAFHSGYHYLGACRMAQNRRDGVVDSFGAVHGIDGLFVAGGATFPGSGAIHPTLTMVALAIRTAERLLGGVLR